MQEVPVLAGSGNGQNILERLHVLIPRRECLDLAWSVLLIFTSGGEYFTILIDASARLINVGATSPSWPALSSAAASQSDSTVPTSWAKHSVHLRSIVGLPPDLDQPQHFFYFPH